MLRLLALALLPAAGSAADPTVTVTGGDKDATNVVCTVPAPAGLSASDCVLVGPPGAISLGQIGPARLGKMGQRELTFVVSELKAHAVTKYTAQPQLKDVFSFAFAEAKGDHTDTRLGDRPVLRFVHKRHDASTSDSHDLTFKPFHHVFDPVDGKTLVTSGAYPTRDKSKLYPHHRGLFLGWMKAGYGANTADTWHGKNGVYTEVDKVTHADAGPVYGRQRARINWIGADGLQFAEEDREVTAYRVDGGTLIDFTAVVATKLPKVTLDGDPQHAGFHFRAAQDVAATKAKTVFTRPDGADKPGATRNWPDAKTHVDLPWTAMSYTAGGTRYTAVMLRHPDNPAGARHSERDYGRFGSYFVATVTPKSPVTVRYRVFIKRGDVRVDECEKLSRGFAGGVTVAVKP